MFTEDDEKKVREVKKLIEKCIYGEHPLVGVSAMFKILYEIYNGNGLDKQTLSREMCNAWDFFMMKSDSKKEAG